VHLDVDERGVSVANCLRWFALSLNLKAPTSGKLEMQKTLAIVAAAACLAGCASQPQLTVDPKSIVDTGKFATDQNECLAIAKNYDLSGNAVKNAAVGAAAGGATVAGIATAVAGAVFLPAIPFIIAGAAAGGGLMGGSAKKKETEAREAILAQCMTDRGYKVYTAK
jgi:hypothetical protein